MPRLIVNGWGVLVDFTWGIVDVVIDAKNNTNSSDFETKVLNICHGGAVVYSSRTLLKNLLLGASPILLYK
jgi:hypothetical protein